MATRPAYLQTLFVSLGILLSFTVLILSSNTSSTHPKAISDLKETIVKGLGLHDDDLKVFGFDLRDALVGYSVSYEFGVVVDDNVRRIKLMDDVSRWEYVDLPIFRVEEDGRLSEENETQMVDSWFPDLAPFQLAGPMEVWIQDADDMRISLPDDVDVGVLKKVILTDGAIVTVKGARSVRLLHPISLPLPLNQTNNGLPSGLLTLAQQLHDTSSTQRAPLISLCIVGPTSLTSIPSSSSSSVNKLKLSVLAPGHVKLSSRSKAKPHHSISPKDLSPKLLNTMWPFTSINTSHSKLHDFESTLSSLLGPKANKEGFFKLLKADVTSQTFVKIGFGVEKKLKGALNWGDFLPAWRTKPETVRTYFEVVAKVDGDKITAQKVIRVNPVEIVDTFALNMSLNNLPIINPLTNFFTL